MFGGTGNIFISYRRDDSRIAAGLIYERLKRQYSASQLFIDVDSIAGGAEFVRILEDRLKRTRVVLAIIGDQWLDIRHQNGGRRLEDPADFVRMEIAQALQHDVVVIPVLLEQAPLPDAKSLPDDLKPLVERQVRRVRHDTFSADMSLIIRDIRNALRPPPEVIRRRNRRIAGAAAAASLGLCAAVWQDAWLSPLKHSVEMVRATISDWQQSLRDRARLADDFAWETATIRGDIADYESYLKLNSEGRFRAEAEHRIKALRAQRELEQKQAEERASTERQRIAREEDERSWQAAKSANQVEAYRAYLWQRPSGAYATDARARIATIEAETRKQAEAARLAAERQADRRAWEAAETSGQTWDYRAYLQQLPDGAFASMARERIASLEAAATRAEEEARRERERQRVAVELVEDTKSWNEALGTDEIIAYRVYLHQRPNGRFSKDARDRIAALEEAARQRGEAQRREQERVRAEAARHAEEQAWSIAKEASQISQYQGYLLQWPDGRFAKEARNRIAALREQEQREADARVAAAAATADRARMQPPVLEPENLALELQKELKRVGCDPGSTDGDWSGQSAAALKRFATLTKLELITAEPTMAALVSVTSQKVRVCPLECGADQRASGGGCIAAVRSTVVPKSMIPRSQRTPRASASTGTSVVANGGGSGTRCRDGDLAWCRVLCSAGRQIACAKLNRDLYGIGGGRGLRRGSGR